MSIPAECDARSERARARRWAQRLMDLARASDDRPAAAEAARRALEGTERAARTIDARRRAIEQECS